MHFAVGEFAQHKIDSSRNESCPKLDWHSCACWAEIISAWLAAILIRHKCNNTRRCPEMVDRTNGRWKRRYWHWTKDTKFTSIGHVNRASASSYRRIVVDAPTCYTFYSSPWNEDIYGMACARIDLFCARVLSRCSQAAESLPTATSDSLRSSSLCTSHYWRCRYRQRPVKCMLKNGH